MREEFMAGLEDRRYLSIADARAKRLQVGNPATQCRMLEAFRSLNLYITPARSELSN